MPILDPDKAVRQAKMIARRVGFAPGGVPDAAPPAAPASLPHRIPNPITAYHGSPYSFDKFDASKIGTGEGAQAYGHGLYFAQNEGVAKQYRDALKWRGTDWSDPQSLASYYVQKFGADGARQWLEAESASAKKSPKNYPDQAANKAVEDALALINNGYEGDKRSVNPGSMYQVAIHAEPDEFLDWDASDWTNQDKAKAAYDQMLGRETSRPTAAMKIGQARGITPQQQATKLAAAGIRGIRYLDQGSRVPTHVRDNLKSAKENLAYFESNIDNPPEKSVLWGNKHNEYTKQKWGEYARNQIAELKKRIPELESELRKHEANQSHNYVVFDPEDIEIARRYAKGGDIRVMKAGGGSLSDQDAINEAMYGGPYGTGLEEWEGTPSTIVSDADNAVTGPVSDATGFDPMLQLSANHGRLWGTKGQPIKRGGRVAKAGGGLSQAINSFSKDREAQFNRAPPQNDARLMQLALSERPELAVAPIQQRAPDQPMTQNASDLGDEIDRGARFLMGEPDQEETRASAKGAVVNGKPLTPALRLATTPSFEPGNAGSPGSEPFGAAKSGDPMPTILAGIRHMETGGVRNPYSYVSPAGALGAYGIMPKTLAAWSALAGYKGISPRDFIANPDAQDAVAAVGAKNYFDRYGGDVGSIGQAWLGGPGSVGKRGVTDPWTGMSTIDYGNRLSDYVGRNYHPQPENAGVSPPSMPPQQPPVVPESAPGNGALSGPQAQADPMSNVFDRIAFAPDVQAGYDNPSVLFDPDAVPSASRGGAMRRRREPRHARRAPSPGMAAAAGSSPDPFSVPDDSSQEDTQSGAPSPTPSQNPMSNIFDRVAFSPEVQAGYDNPQVLFDPNAAPSAARGGRMGKKNVAVNEGAQQNQPYDYQKDYDQASRLGLTHEDMNRNLDEHERQIYKNIDGANDVKRRMTDPAQLKWADSQIAKAHDNLSHVNNFRAFMQKIKPTKTAQRGGVMKRAAGGSVRPMPTDDLVMRALDIIRRRRAADGGSQTAPSLQSLQSQYNTIQQQQAKDEAAQNAMINSQRLTATQEMVDNNQSGLPGWEPKPYPYARDMLDSAIMAQSSMGRPQQNETPALPSAPIVPATGGQTIGNVGVPTGNPLGSPPPGNDIASYGASPSPIPMAGPTPYTGTYYNNALDEVLGTNSPTSDQVFGFNYPVPPAPKAQPVGPISQDNINAMYGFGMYGGYNQGGAVLMDALNKARRAIKVKRNRTNV